MKPGSLSLVSWKSLKGNMNGIPDPTAQSSTASSSLSFNSGSRVLSLSQVVSSTNRSILLQGRRHRARAVINGQNPIRTKVLRNDQLQYGIDLGGKKPGECPHCGKNFNTPAEMMRHTRIHTGEKPYKCYICVYATAFNGDLVRHLKSRHPGKCPYVCHLCDFKCHELLMFNNHRRRTGHGGRASISKMSYPEISASNVSYAAVS
jgi:uncharacterized Zn-finger protein